MKDFARKNGLQLETDWFYEGKKQRAFARAAKALRLAPSWWVWAALYTLSRPEAAAK
jgi:hypothetical protein